MTRYFQRIGPTVVLQEQGVETALLVAGPTPPTDDDPGEPGQMVAIMGTSTCHVMNAEVGDECIPNMLPC